MKQDNTIKNSIVTVVIVLIVAGALGFLFLNKENGFKGNDGGDNQNAHTLVGSSANYESLPSTSVFANSTTTDDTNTTDQLADGGATIYQRVETLGADFVYLDVHAVGGTATSTLTIRQMSSFNGVDYSTFATSTLFSATTDFIITSTSTLDVQPIAAVSWDPGLASTTDGVIIPFKTNGARYTRFILTSEDKATDPDDGVQAWITAIIPENFN